MKYYKNLQKNSGIKAFETGDDYIKIVFVTGETYVYTNQITGTNNVAIMKRLAEEGRGLSTFISKYVKNKYVK